MGHLYPTEEGGGIHDQGGSTLRQRVLGGGVVEAAKDGEALDVDVPPWRHLDLDPAEGGEDVATGTGTSDATSGDDATGGSDVTLSPEHGNQGRTRDGCAGGGAESAAMLLAGLIAIGLRRRIGSRVVNPRA